MVFVYQGDVVFNFVVQYMVVVLVYGYIFDEVECFVMLFVVFGQVGCYLDWVVDCYVQCELLCECVGDGLVVVFFQVEDVGGVIYWFGQYLGEYQVDFVFGWIGRLVLGVVFYVMCVFVGYLVGIGVVQVGVFDWFVWVYCDVLFCCFLYYF